jgi:ankyrin repeat protein
MKSLNDQMIDAVIAGDLAQVKRLMRKYNTSRIGGGYHDKQPLIYAAQYGHLTILKYLISQNWLPNIIKICTSKEVLRYAIDHHQLRVIKYLSWLQYAPYNQESLQDAAKYGLLWVIKRLVQTQGCMARDSQALYAAIRGGYLKVVKYLISQGNIVDDQLIIPLSWAIKENQPRITRFLLRQSDCPESYYPKLILLAANKRYLRILRLLFLFSNRLGLDKGVWHSALVTAAEQGSVKIMRYLIQQGQDPCDNNNEALKAAVYHNHLKAIKFLVTHGADLRGCGKLLHDLISEGNFRPLRYLLKNQAYPNQYLSPVFQEAIKGNNYKIVRHLVKYQGMPNLVSHYPRLLESLIKLGISQLIIRFLIYQGAKRPYNLPSELVKYYKYSVRARYLMAWVPRL